MTSGPLRVLLVEDNPGDARLILELVREDDDSGLEMHWVTDLSLAFEHLANGDADVTLLDLGLPGSRGIETLRKFQNGAPTMPVVVLTGLMDEGVATEAVALGAQDYLNKGSVGHELLTRSLRYAVERRRAVNRLRLAQFSIDCSADSVFWLRRDGSFAYVNDAACRELAYEREHLLGLTVFDIDPDFPRETWPDHWRALKEAGSLHLESRHRASHGRVFPVGITANYVEFDGQEYNFAHARDITEHRAAEETLRHYQHMVSNSTDMQALLGWDYCYKAANEAYLHAFDKSWDEVVGHSVAEVAGEAFFRDSVRPHAELCMAGQDVSYAAWMDLPGGGRQCLEVVYSPYRADGGEIVGFVVNARDITERRTAAQELEAYRDHLEEIVAARTSELEAANDELEAFAYSVSHDLRAPLRAIHGYSEILREERSGLLDEEGHRLLGVVRDNASLMGVLIDDLLEFSRVGRRDMERRTVDMGALAQTVLDDLEAADGDAERRVTLGPLPQVWGDPSMLRQVWVNLLSNAFKFSRDRRPAVIEIQGAQEGAECVYSVRDNGAGFDMRYADKLFGVFERLHGRDEFEGTGVGLAIVARVIERHGGRVWGEGKVGEGATLRFAIPVNGAPVNEGEA